MPAGSTILAAFLELTYDCNFACPHCYNAVARRAELDTAAWRAVMDRLAELGCLEVLISGGEPLLRGDVLELLAHARARRFSVRVLTNGSAFASDMADALARLKPTALGVTIYGADEETYARVAAVRGGWAGVRAGVARAAAAGLPLWPRMLVTRHNVAQIDAVRAWAESVTGRPLQVMAGITVRDDGDLRPLRERVDRGALPGACGAAREGRCGVALRGIGINPYGDIFACQELRTPLGNVLRDDLGAVWETHPYLKALRAVRSRPCQACGAVA